MKVGMVVAFPIRPAVEMNVLAWFEDNGFIFFRLNIMKYVIQILAVIKIPKKQSQLHKVELKRRKNLSQSLSSELSLTNT